MTRDRVDAQMSERVEAALTYARHGWPVLPLHGVSRGRCTCGKDCGSPGKHPLTEHGFRDATTDEGAIRRWWERTTRSNIGVPTGADSGFVVLDVDPRHDGDESLRDLEGQHGALPDTVQSLTGGGGRHIFFAHPGRAVPNKAALAPGLDVRGDGGYVVAPPSDHASGQQYEWEASSDPGGTELAPVPQWLMALMVEGATRKNAPVVAGSIPEGQRHKTLTSLAGSMRRRGMGEESIRAAILIENKRCSPEPLSRAEVEGIAQRVARYKPAEARTELAAVVAASMNGTKPAPNAEAVEPPLKLPLEVRRPVFDDYLEAVDGSTEAADEHHFFALMGVIGALLGRRAWIHYSYPLFPNFYILNVGPPGSTKKTSAIRAAVSAAARVDPALSTASAVGSGEGLLEALAGADATEPETNPRHRRLLLVQSEIGQLLAKAKQDGSGTLMPIILDAFDCPNVLNPRTRTKPITATKPTLSIVAATTPSQLQHYVGYDDLYGGLGSRLLVAVGEPKPPIPMPSKIEPGRLNAVVRAVSAALKRWDRPTEFQIRPDAEERWNQAYLTWKGGEKALGPKADIVSRTHVLGLKMALVFAALENDEPWIEDGQIEAGVLAADFAQECALNVLGELGDSKTAQVEGRIVRKVTTQPGVTMRQLQQFIGGGCDSVTFRRLMDAMFATGKLTETDGGIHVGV